MPDVMLEQRVTNLEEAMAELARTAAQTSVEVDRLSREMREFKQEMREFKEESRLSREKSEANLEAYRQEWRAEHEASREKSEANLEAYRQEWRAEHDRFRRDLNQKYGEMANKMGTLAEDLVAPSLPRILIEVVPCPADGHVSMAVRVRRFHPTEPGQSQEFDVIASCGAYVLFNETKSRLRPSDVEQFIARLEQVRPYFPEYEGFKIIGALAALYIDPSLITYGSRWGVLMLATGDALMEVVNGPGLVLREF